MSFGISPEKLFPHLTVPDGKLSARNLCREELEYVALGTNVKDLKLSTVYKRKGMEPLMLLNGTRKIMAGEEIS
ncbi:hypothetical protein V6N12_072691 [Hibiscus sabdariffa]|uniref:Uncharacterized protein n=1 Tax=Hibiscus sabdariffa TaxID=183260 RepID=A0ABR2BK53_9ROSI